MHARERHYRKMGPFSNTTAKSKRGSVIEQIMDNVAILEQVVRYLQCNTISSQHSSLRTDRTDMSEVPAQMQTLHKGSPQPFDTALGHDTSCTCCVLVKKVLQG
jgi:hypothetical protein